MTAVSKSVSKMASLGRVEVPDLARPEGLDTPTFQIRRFPCGRPGPFSTVRGLGRK